MSSSRLRSVLSESTVEAALAWIFSHTSSQDLSLKALHSVLLHLPIENCDLVESAFIKLTAFAVGSQAPEESRLACIRATAEALEASGMKPLSETVAHTCLIVWPYPSLHVTNFDMD